MKKIWLYILVLVSMSLVMSCNKDDDYEPLGIKASPYKITCDEITLTHSYNGEYKDEYDYYGNIDPQGETVNIVINVQDQVEDNLFLIPISYGITIPGLPHAGTYGEDNNNYINSEWDANLYDITKPIISGEGISISLVPETNLTTHPTLNVQFEANKTGKNKAVFIHLLGVMYEHMADITLIQKSI